MMQQITRLTGSVLLVIGVLSSPVAGAFDFGDMMNPSRWFGGDRDYRDDYHDGPWGPGYGPGYYGAPPDYIAPGYGAPGYPPPGYAAPAYGYAPPAHNPPAAADSTTSSEIRKLKQRIEQLEQEQAAAAAASQHYGNYPASKPAATAAPPPAHTAPTVRELTPAPAVSISGSGTPVDVQAAPSQGAGQPGHQPQSTGEWRPSGYYHPAMQ